MNHAIEGLEQIPELLQWLAHTRNNMRQLFMGVGNIIINATDEAFEKEGPGWRPLSPATYHLSYTNLNRSKRQTHTKRGKITRGFERYIANKKILQQSEQLRNSITMRATDSEVVVGSNLPYAAIHQFGGMAGQGKKVKIHARPYFPITGNTLRSDVLKSTGDYLQIKLKEEIS